MRNTCLKLTVFILILTSFLSLFAEISKLRIEGKAKLITSDIISLDIVDVNMEQAALITFLTDLDVDMAFDPAKGLVRPAGNPKPGRWEVYVSPGERYITVNATGYKEIEVVLSTYGISRLKSGQSYTLDITGDKKKDFSLVVISDPPNAEKWLDGELLGTGESFPISKGEHRLVVKADGYGDYTKTFNANETVTTLKNIKLEEAEPVMLTIKSNPTGANVSLDGASQGVTNCQTFMFPGTYKLKISLDKYDTIEENIKITENGDNTFNYNLQKITSKLTINVTPSDATILVNNTKLYSNTKEVGPGKYKIDVEKAGYYSDSETITIIKGQDKSVSFNLTPKTGKIQITVNPMEATSVLKRNGSTYKSWSGSKFLKDVPIGDYELVTSLSGYKTNNKRISVTTGNTTNERILLEPGVTPVVSSSYGGKTGNMVFVKGGTFQMGSNNGGSDEKPVHSVTLDDFYIGKYEVTNEEYIQFLNDKKVSSNGSYGGNELIDMDDDDCAIGYRSGDFYFKGSKYADNKDCPVIEVTWYGAKAYCEWAGGRLPTEAEWEYASKGGIERSRNTKYAGSDNIDEVAWYKSNSGSKTHPVGKKKPNELGIYDMSGNVWEWCQDWYGGYSSGSQHNPQGPGSGSARVLRGGSWYDLASYCLVAYRASCHPSSGNRNYGFRIAHSSK